MKDEPKADQTQRLFDLLSSFSVGMVVVRNADNLISGRPMSVKERQGLDFWFMTSRYAGLVDALQSHPETLITMQDSTRYITLNGSARVENDRERIHRNFHESDKVWFPKGPDDPNIVLVHFRPQHAEFWDNSGTRGVAFAVAAAKAYLKGDNLDEAKSPGHGEVQVGPTTGASR